MSVLPVPTDLQIRRALGHSRRTCAPLLGCLLNLEPAPSALGGVGLQVDQSISEVTGLLEVAVVADFALGYSVRQAMQETRWAVPTIGISINLTAELPVYGAARVSATRATVHTSTSLSSATGLAHTSTGASIGHCSALFAVPHRQAVEPLPWELPLTEKSSWLPSAVDEHNGDDDETVGVICQAVAKAGHEDKSWLDVLLDLVSPVVERSGHIERLFLDSALVANRAGHIQGGVLFALGAVSPFGRDSAGPICGDMKFLRPARADLPLRIETNGEDRGRRTEFVSTHLYQGDAIVATGSYVFRRR